MRGEIENKHIRKEMHRMMPDKKGDIVECDWSFGVGNCSSFRTDRVVLRNLD